MSGTSLTDKNGERGMVKTMGMVLFSLFLLALFILSMARLLGMGRGDDESDPIARNMLVGRIEPLGRVRTSADELPHGDGIQVASAETERSGEQLVQGVCAGCHAAGAAGAPKLGDDSAWAPRREHGLDYLVASVVNGKNAMPARGGSDYTDEEIHRAVQYIAMFDDGDEGQGAGAGAAGAGASEDATQGAAEGTSGDAGQGATEGAAATDATAKAEDASGGAASVEASATTMSEEDPAEEVPSGGQVRPADATLEGTAMAADVDNPADTVDAQSTDTAASQPDNDMSSDTAPAAENDMRADEAATGSAAEGGTVTERDAATAATDGGSDELAAAAVATDVGSAVADQEAGPEQLVALIGSGEAPAGLTDHVKGQVDGVCAGCHAAGVANAPRIGDEAAWGERAQLGLTALTQSVANGKGVMPARGGSTLSDEEIPIAIEYLMSKQQ